MPPLQTFIDDPLRVLRVIRFATRFNFQLDNEILLAVRNQDIRESFDKKITRERIGVEVNKMLEGPDPVRALRLVYEFGFYDLVFEVPNDENVPHSALKSVQLASIIRLALSQNLLVQHHGEFSPQDRRFLYFAASVAPYAGQFIKIKTKLFPLSRQIVFSSLKVFF
jgi:tRNA nucleotidyltransferase (CCA-adding enzyme)